MGQDDAAKPLEDDRSEPAYALDRALIESILDALGDGDEAGVRRLVAAILASTT